MRTLVKACLVQISFPLSTNHISQKEGACFETWQALQELFFPFMKLDQILGISISKKKIFESMEVLLIQVHELYLAFQNIGFLYSTNHQDEKNIESL